MKKWKQIIASILFIIMQLNGFFFAYALLLDAIRIDLSQGAMFVTFAVAILSTWAMFAHFNKKGD